MEALETITYKKHTIEIFSDDTDCSPRGNDNVCVFHVAHGRFNFGDINYTSGDDIEETEKKCIRDGDITLPLFLMNHGSVNISLSPFSCPWDSGQVGFVQIPRKSFVEEFGKKIFTPKLKKLALKWAETETKELNSYLRGEVYGYKVDGGDECEDSCWGFIGDMKYCIEEAEMVVDNIVKQDRLDRCEQVKTWIKNQVPLYARNDS